MKVPYSWLREFCDPGISAEELLDLIALRTTDTEGVAYVGPPDAKGFVVGKVVSAEKHPDADRLSVCEVDTGDGTRTIVCGAPNVAAGQTVPVALPGAVMPDGTELGKAKLRGVESNGMILSEAELQIGDDSSGIAVLDEGRPGEPLADLLPIAEPVLELEVHSNRVDCFGVYGVARETHAITAAPLGAPPWDADGQSSGNDEVSDYASVSVEVPELCPRFTARVFEDVQIGPSPMWLKSRLIAAGQRPINNVVDITNYVMLLTAQPLHAFDLDKVPGGKLIIRTATKGEKMTTLDGVQRSFDSDAVLVCDSDGPTGIAGIMGGQVSEVSDSTTRVLLEAATWNGRNILRTSRNLGLRSEASNRFEKQLHPEIAMRAQRVASRLLVELCGARLVPGTIDEAAEVPAARRLELRVERVEGLLGMRIGVDDCSEYLDRLGFEVHGDAEVLEAEVPFARHYDVTREVDLIEEVGRIHGYDRHLPATLPDSVGQAGRLSRDQVLRRRAEDVMRDLGFDAVVNMSLTAPGMPGRLRIAGDDVRAEPIVVANPLSLDHSQLRTTLLGSLLDAAQYNVAHGAERVALYESGRVYLKDRPASDPGTPRTGSSPSDRSPVGSLRAEDVPGIGAEEAAGIGVLGGTFAGDRPSPAFEPQRIGCIAVGAASEPSWRGDAGPADFYALKGALEALAAQLGADLSVEPGQEPFLHPGRSAKVTFGGAEAGWIGEIHPLVCRAWGLDAAAGFEIELGALVAAASLGSEQYEDVTSYPAVHQDLAVVVDEEVAAAQVHEAVTDGGGELLREARVFDLYRGDQVGEGRKSLALRLTFRAPDRTLTDAEVTGVREQIQSKLADLGGRCVSERNQNLQGDPAARVIVAGASGFAGALAAQLLWDHPRLELAAVTSRSDAGRKLNELYPRYRVSLPLTELDLEELGEIDAAIVAYPHAASAPVVAEMRSLGIQVVDLSADFRLRDPDLYEQWYGPHGEPALLSDAVYGLPELYRDQLRDADLVANPGCYPTASILALAPLAEAGLIADLTINAMQGISGAGRGGGDAMHFVTLAENAYAYKVDAHRHAPEIAQELAELTPMPDTSSASSEPRGERSTGQSPDAGVPGSGSGLPYELTFVPHLIPLDQGELVTCFVTPTEDIETNEIAALYEKRYAGEPFVRVVDAPPGVRDVRDTNECHIYAVRNGGRIVAIAAIDNLWKGASGEAVQNLNLMLGLDETEGLR